MYSLLINILVDIAILYDYLIGNVLGLLVSPLLNHEGVTFSFNLFCLCMCVLMCVSVRLSIRLSVSTLAGKPFN